MENMQHLNLTPIACTILRDLGLSDTDIEAVESYSSAVWLTPEHVVHYHIIGSVGRLEHEARVAERLPAEAPDWDLAPFLGFCADPARCVPEVRLEAVSRPEDYRDAPGWLRQAYPEMFAYPRKRDRLLLHMLVLRAEELLADRTQVNQIVNACLEEARALERLLPD